MRFLGVIPARYSSTRLEGKPLKDICGHTMIEWVYKRCKKSKLDDVIVATDDERIFKEVLNFGGKAFMTSKNHSNGTSRIAELCEKISDFDVVINIQGDEPLIEAEMIDSLINSFVEDKELNMATLKHKIISEKEVNDPNNVKVVTDIDNFAVYFSRAAIPFPRKNKDFTYYKHVGIYGYKRDFVLKYVTMPSSPLEEIESLEQLRVLENGYKIKVLETKYEIIGVDTEENLKEVIDYINGNSIKLD